MLKNTFCHLPGIGLKTECVLWEAGIRSWDDFGRIATATLPRGRLRSLGRHLRDSSEHLENGNTRYFADMLPNDQQWRMFSDFRETAAYLDIETNGFAGARGSITTIALYDGESIFHYVKGHNLHEFPHAIRNYRLVVTYNGTCFDLPFIESRFGIRLHAAHIDLRYVLKSLGFVGGLKGCERQLGIERGDLDGIDGYFAVLLWRDFIRNENSRALETLLAYNVQDVVSLEQLMVIAYNLKLRGTPFYERARLPLPPSPGNPFTPDNETIEKLGRMGRCYS